MVISAAFLKIIVDTFVIKSFAMNVEFLSQGRKKTNNYWLCQIFIWSTIVLTVLESLTVATSRLVYTPELFGDSS